MKNINELIGLIEGIDFDGVINQKETDRLQFWVDRNRNLAYEANEIDLINLVDDILEDHIITEYERQVLVEYCNKYKSNFAGNSEIFILQGILEGIVSDEVINSLEIERLQEWMERYGDILCIYPKCQNLVNTIREILEDGVVTEEECQTLLDIINNKIGEVQFEAKVEYLRNQVKAKKNIGVDLIDLLEDEGAINTIHSLAEKELFKRLRSYYGTGIYNREIVFISLTIIAMLHYEEGRLYESIEETYANLYNEFSPQKIAGHIRSLLSQYGVETNERQINVALRNAVVPGHYLPVFFDFIFDIYKINFSYDLPEDMYDEFRFVYEGLRQVMMSDGDDVQVNVTKKTYKLIKTTKQLIADPDSVDSVIKLSIIIVRLIDKKIWNKEIKVYNPYLKQGFDKWAKKISESKHDLQGRKESLGLRSRWEPKYTLLDNTVYIVPPVHRIKAVYDYSTVRIEVENQGEVLYVNNLPNIKEIMGGYEIVLDKIKIQKPLGNISYKLYAGDDVIYDSKESLFRDVIAFSFEDSSEIKNNTDYKGTAIFCYRDSCNAFTPYHKTEDYMLAQYGASLGDSVLIGKVIFNFSSLARPGVFGEEIAGHFLYDPNRKHKYSVFKAAKYLVFETTRLNADLAIEIDGVLHRITDLEFQLATREGVEKYVVDIPFHKSGFHVAKVYEIVSGGKREICSFEYAEDLGLCEDIREVGEEQYYLSVKSDLLDTIFTGSISASTFSLEWLSTVLIGRRFAYSIPLPATYYSLDGKKWCSSQTALWIGDISSETVIKVNNRQITEIQVYGSDGALIEEPLKMSDKIMYREARIGFLKSYAEDNAYFLLVLIEKGVRSTEFICYNKCMMSQETTIEYDMADKCLDITPHFLGKGNVYFTIEDGEGQQVYKSSLVEDGDTTSIEGLSSFIIYSIIFFEKKKGLSLSGDRQLECFKKVFYDWSDLVGKEFKIREVLYDCVENKNLIRKTHFFNKTTICITKQIDQDLFEGELYTNTSKGSFYLFNINPVEVEICSDVIGGSVELSITKDGDGLLLDQKHHAVMNSLDDPHAADIFSYTMDLKGMKFV